MQVVGPQAHLLTAGLTSSMRNATLAVLVCVVPAAVLALATQRAAINSFAGPYHVIITEASQCPEGIVTPGASMGNLTGSLRHVRSSRYQLYNGQIVLKRDIVVGKFGIKVAVAKWDPVAGWRENNFFNLEGVPGDPRAEVCNVVSTLVKDAIDAVSRSQPQIPNRCPFRKGTYIIRNLSTALLERYEDFPVLQYGRFRADVIFYLMKSRQIIVGCARGAGDIVPKLKTS
ncbi:uncharacterized protein LOC127749914 [Frankliniella occidentalis]|uniref:Uncharacterized protein LOC127749914 n=1 Tax=Frankliniella occidentalis TaxID=133901 RepID=A0A9C6UBU1_FRAOC|nr:uncharacterized protein LOC127749914 [Frankliniella occidentalis]